MARRTWLLAGALVLAVAVGVIGTLAAQVRPVPVPGQPYIPFMPGRFVVAKVDGANIILLDTATGGLYKATADDAKKYADLPKPEARPVIRPLPVPPDKPPIRPRPPVEKERDPDKPRNDPNRDGNE